MQPQKNNKVVKVLFTKTKDFESPLDYTKADDFSYKIKALKQIGSFIFNRLINLPNFLRIDRSGINLIYSYFI